MKIVTSSVFAVLMLGVNAQNATMTAAAQVDESKAATLRPTVQLLTEKLDLSADQAAMVAKLDIEAENETADLKAECAKIQSAVNARYDEMFDAVAKTLTPEQAAKLADMRNAGEIHAANCHTGESKAPVAGCCAGKGHASSTTGK